MAVTNEDVMALQSGDHIVIISEDEAKEKDFWYGNTGAWAIPDMNAYCGDTLTVTHIEVSPSSTPHVYVEENFFWWRHDFIDHIIKSPHVSYSVEDIESVLFGGA